MRNHLARGGAVGVIAAVLVLLGSGLAYAGHCHHPKPPPTRHVTVSASFTDQFCFDVTLFVPGRATHSDTDGVWWSSTGSTKPGDTFTWTAHAFTRRGVVIDGPRTFSHTFPAVPTAESCVPPKPLRASYKLRYFNGCTPSRRYVQVVHRHHVQKVTKHHSKKRTVWHIKVRADKGALFKGGVRVDYVTVGLIPPSHCDHPHGS